MVEAGSASSFRRRRDRVNDPLTTEEGPWSGGASRGRQPGLSHVAGRQPTSGWAGSPSRPADVVAYRSVPRRIPPAARDERAPRGCGNDSAPTTRRRPRGPYSAVQGVLNGSWTVRHHTAALGPPGAPLRASGAGGPAPAPPSTGSGPPGPITGSVSPGLSTASLPWASSWQAVVVVWMTIRRCQRYIDMERQKLLGHRPDTPQERRRDCAGGASAERAATGSGGGPGSRRLPRGGGATTVRDRRPRPAPGTSAAVPPSPHAARRWPRP